MLPRPQVSENLLVILWVGEKTAGQPRFAGAHVADDRK
jgi:hypothetical protein